ASLILGTEQRIALDLHRARAVRQPLPCPARAPKPNRPGPGRPLGSKNRRLAPRYDVGKTVKRPETLIERDQARP
ncbi:hypothetical protein ACIP24_39995, partial [Streptomyces bobili]